ncbi:MAG: hypothetical protein JRF33_03075 [Deltaproteobacteria bacterium]|nr:hypothetical protein [Deltaproteobacteria bacterium]
MRKFLKILPLAMLALSLMAMGCSSDNGNTDECADGTFLCADEACHACCNDDHCDQGFECSTEFVCTAVCSDAGSDCSADPASCCEGLACDPFDRECVTVCGADADCVALHSDMLFSGDLKCQNDGTCDFDHCANDDNCPPGTVCYGGDCVSPVGAGDVDHCIVVPASAVIREGTTAEFAVTAFMASGALAPGVTFEWASDDTDVATVAAGVVTGGSTTGTASITANVVSGVTCTPAASVVNFGAVEAGHTRVVVVDEMAGTLIAGATVRIVGDGYDNSIDTSAEGIADFDDIELAAATLGTVTVSAGTHAPVTVMDVTSNDLILHVGLIHDPTMSGGFRGRFDFDSIVCAPGDTCEVKLGLAGPSIPGNLFNLSFDMLIGEMIMTHIEFGGSDMDTPLPGGLILGLNDTWFREIITSTGVPGTRVAWGLGGKLNLGELITLLGPIISGGGEDIDIGGLLVSILPLFQDFYTGIKPNVDITAIAKVVDVNDINGDEDTTDLVPDYDNFPELQPDGMMGLGVPMDQSMTFNVGALPSCGDGYCYDGIILLAGVMVKDAGLVPLGITAGMDKVDEEDTPNGQIEAMTLFLSDVAGRLPEDQVQRVVVALGLNIGGLMDDTGGGLTIAGQVLYVDSFSGTHSLPAFMTPADVTFDAAARTATLTALPAGIDYMHMILDGAAASWQIMAPSATAGTVFDLPEDPASGSYMDALNFVAIDLADGTSFQDIPAFNGSNMDSLVELVGSFVFGTAGVPGE